MPISELQHTAAELLPRIIQVGNRGGMPLLQIRPVAITGVLLDDERGFQHCTHICFRQDHRCDIVLNSSNVSMAQCVYTLAGPDYPTCLLLS